MHVDCLLLLSKCKVSLSFWPKYLLEFLEQVSQVDCYTIQAQELETIIATFKFTSMLQGKLY